MAFAPERKKMDPKDFEQVEVNKLLNTQIIDVQYENGHQFPSYEGKPGKVADAVRFKFAIEGMKYNRYSKWMTFTMGSKGALYSKYLSALVKGIKPDTKFDIDHLVGMKIQTLWKQNGEYQNLEVIVPVDPMVEYTEEPAGPKSSTEPDEEGQPF